MSEYTKGIAREIILGDFNKGDSTIAGTAGNVVIGLIPFVGQIADARDTIAAIKEVGGNHKDMGAWVGLGIVLVCWIPGTDALKGAKKQLKGGVKEMLKYSDGFAEGARLALDNGNWKVYFGRSNQIDLLLKDFSLKKPVTWERIRKSEVRKLFYNDVTHNWNRRRYKNAGTKDLSEIDMHHLFGQHNIIKNNIKFQGIINSGFNYLEVPSEFNRWMGGINIRERAFRAIVLSILSATFLASGGWKAGSEIYDFFFGSSQEESISYEKSITLK